MKRVLFRRFIAHIDCGARHTVRVLSNLNRAGARLPSGREYQFNMSISSISGIENMLAQMRQVAESASALPAAASTGKPGRQGGFAAELSLSLQRVSQAQDAAAAQARAFQAGEPGVSLNDVMIDMQKASLAFQATIQVRNRLVAAYQEIASMPV